ncbi:MAG TPA: hypothetical protein VNT99_08260 [Methylomirabilota bacterium]|nr:hypothetical protein [Methylomirabilota bacterium]
MTRNFIFEKTDVLTQSRDDLRDGKAASSRGEKLTKAAKAKIAAVLLAEREFNVKDMGLGDIVIIKHDGVDILMLEQKNSGDRLSITRIQSERPDIVEEFTAPTPATYFNVLA